MIENLLPDATVAIEVREDLPYARLFPSEAALVARSVEKRRREFTTGRACAHEALIQLGFPPSPVTSGSRGEPQWPPGVVGSITHCDGYRACAVARLSGVAAIGIDAEANAPLPDGVLSQIARPTEIRCLRDLRLTEREVHWDRLLFSAKESVYKAWYPLTRRWLDFEEADVTVDPAQATFTARLLVAGPTVAGRELKEFRGRWLVKDALVLTAITVAAPATPSKQ